MRPALEQVQRIEEYLLGKMSDQEKVAFESEMENDPQLQKEVAAQKQVMSAIKRVGVKSAAVSAYSGWKIRKWLLRGGIAFSVIGGAFLCYVLWPVAEKEDCVPCETKTEQFIGEEVAQSKDNCCEETFFEPGPAIEDTVELLTVEAWDTSCVTEDVEVNDNNSEQKKFDEEGDVIVPEIDAVSEVSDNQEGNKNLSPSTQINALKKVVDNDPVYVNQMTEFQPEFPGGETAMHNWIRKNIEYPQNSIANNEKGYVYVQFIVNKDGSLSDHKILQSVSEDIDAEAIRVIKKMPRWNPAVKDGKAVRYLFTLPIYFTF